jgi:imidazolonepropionase
VSVAVNEARRQQPAFEVELLALAQPRLARLLREGVTTLEIKSGYGLDLQNERKMLRVARQLADDKFAVG